MGNSIKDISSITTVPYLLTLDASRNKIEDITCLTEKGKLEYLQELNLSGNKMTELLPINLPNLQTLNLSKNQIVSLEKFGGHKMLKKLNLTKNKLKNLNGLKDLPELVELTVNQNKKLKEFGDISGMPKLKTLFMKACKIKVFAEKLPEFPSLEVVDFSETKLKTLPELTKIK